MPKDTKPIEVPAGVAEAYRSASPESRRRAEQAMEAALMTKEEAVRAFRNITERAGEHAGEQGLTSEKLDELLREKIEESPEENPYSWLKTLSNAKLSGPEDASVTYEQKLPEKQQDEAVDSLLNRLKALCKIGARPLAEMVGAGTGLYESPEQVDDEIRKQREEWDY